MLVVVIKWGLLWLILCYEYYVDVRLGFFCSYLLSTSFHSACCCARQTHKQTANQSIPRSLHTLHVVLYVKAWRHACLYQVPPYVVLFFARTTHLAIAQLVERRTVVGNIKLTSLGRWFKSASRELFLFALVFHEKHLEPDRLKRMACLSAQYLFIWPNDCSRNASYFDNEL